MTIRYIICYMLACWIFFFSLYRDICFHQALNALPTVEFFTSEYYKLAVCGTLFVLGQTFVTTSFLRLGITGTFLGDYCGILMNERVTGFPFNVLDNPMYVGSTMTFLSFSLYHGSIPALILTALVYIVYQIALVYEESYTAEIYEERARNQKAAASAKLK
jgi:phosphatidylethanolamine N-methyltransferase